MSSTPFHLTGIPWRPRHTSQLTLVSPLHLWKNLSSWATDLYCTKNPQSTKPTTNPSPAMDSSLHTFVGNIRPSPVTSQLWFPRADIQLHLLDSTWHFSWCSSKAVPSILALVSVITQVISSNHQPAMICRSYCLCWDKAIETYQLFLLCGPLSHTGESSDPWLQSTGSVFPKET